MFLGMVGYCRQWIPNFSIISNPLIKLKGKEIKDEPYTIALSKEELESFMELRECMCRAPALGVPNWIHASHTKKVTCPTDEELEVSSTTVPGREVSGPESSQEGTETAGEPTENNLVPQTVNEFERGDRVPISVESAGELSQGEVLPEVDGYGLELESVTDQEKEEEEREIIERDQSVPASPEPVAGPSSENTILQEEGAVQGPEKTNRKKTHKGDNWPEKAVIRIRSIPSYTITEETDTSRVEDLSEGELQGECRLKRK
ncbi:hypothetical protein NDU88_000966 [Pleurodeles waltl]|uniref:Uncharacterized protein n=1 Tax=Pleurodeles waltl TaxID=8319 RepID=A0AAV7SYV6_PLEWA|nr:hypothetical protein NDU88_000966 [Pleurodeles waltl]